MSAQFIEFFNPRSIAVVGASNNLTKVGGIVFNNILNSSFKGKVYPVNNSENHVLGQQVFKNVYDIKTGIDLVLVAIPAASTVELLEELGSMGYKNFVLYASGFSEIGNAGELLDLKLKKIIKKYNLNVLGPNCFGFINNSLNLNSTFANFPNKVGNIKFISQSGAIASSLFDFFSTNNIGISEFVTIGNKSGINEVDVLNYFYENSSKGEDFSIGIYLESISNGPKFLDILKKLSIRHRIFILKPGKTSASQKAMMSHTASLAGDDLIFETAIKEAGILRVETLEEFFDLSIYLSSQKIPSTDSLTIITNAGGPGVISADFTYKSNLKLDSYSEDLKNILKNSLPPAVSVLNPIDLVGDARADRFKIVCEIFKNTDYSNFLFIITPQLATQIKETSEIILNFKKLGKNVFVSFIGGGSFLDAKKYLVQNSVPVFSYPEKALNLLSKILNHSSIKNSNLDNTDKLIPRDIMLDPILSNKLLHKYKIKTPKTFYLNSKNTSDLKFPLILKLTSPNLLHKKVLGGVSELIYNKSQLLSQLKLLMISQNKLLKQGYTDIQVIAQEVISEGVEIILGNRNDGVFGDFLLISVGGYLSEFIQDRVVILNPITKTKIEKNLKNSSVGKILANKNLNLEELVEIIIKFSQIKKDNAFINEIEINPIIYNEKGIWAIDPKVILNKNKDNE